MLIGGNNPDRFDFNAVIESRPSAALRDVVCDFHRTQHDRIDLSTIDAYAGKAGNQAFLFIGSDTFARYHSTHPAVFGMVRFADGNVQANMNANLAPDLEIHVNGMTAMTQGDFLL